MSNFRNDPALFMEGDLDATLRGQEPKLRQEIDAYPANKLLNTPLEDLVAYFVEKYKVEAIALAEDQIATEEAETELEARRLPDAHFLFPDETRTVPATAVSFFVPFTGDPLLFRLRPNSFDFNPPHATIQGSEMIVTFVSRAPNATTIKSDFEAELRRVKEYLRNQASLIGSYNHGLANTARTAIGARRNRLLQAQNTTASLGYPMRRRQDTPTTYAAPSVRRRVLPSQPRASDAPYRAEPALPMDEYEHILGIMANMALVLERSPSAFSTMQEEDLRQHFLVQLNGHYEGTATGETFNVGGKTDILIRENGKNIFIAECKFWRGPSGFQEAIEQLLSYTSWRDTKTAIIIFNRDTAISTVLAKVPGCLQAHANFKRAQAIDGEGRFRAVLRQNNDSSREMVVTILVFDVPAEVKA